MSPVDTPLLSEETLNNANRVLFMTHLAIGDFVFQGVFLKALKQQYPHLQLDVWTDDCRNTAKDWYKGRNSTLAQWIDTLPFIDTLYPIAANEEEREQLISKARAMHYDIIVFIATQRTEKYAEVATKISSGGLVVGSRNKPLQHPVAKWWHFRKLHRVFNIDQVPVEQNAHIFDVYRARFETCFGTITTASDDRFGLHISVPEEYRAGARSQLSAWAAHASSPKRFVLINPLSTSPKRDYHWQQVEQLIIRLHKVDNQLGFIINAAPNELEGFEAKIQSSHLLKEVMVTAYSATEHFYQLPAMIEAVSFIITVETAIMHLASTLACPQVVLMRKSASQWRPLNATQVLYAARHVSDIPVDDVVTATKLLLSEHK